MDYNNEIINLSILKIQNNNVEKETSSSSKMDSKDIEIDNDPIYYDNNYWRTPISDFNLEIWKVSY